MQALRGLHLGVTALFHVRRLEDELCFGSRFGQSPVRCVMMTSTTSNV